LPFPLTGRATEGGGALIGIAAVEIIRIDHREGLVDDPAGGPDGMGGAPGLDPAIRHGEAGGQVVDPLKCVIHLDPIGKPRADPVFEGLGEILPDDEDHPAETRADGIEDGVVENGFAIGAHRVHLLEAPVAGAHTGGGDGEGGLSPGWWYRWWRGGMYWSPGWFPTS